MMEGIYNGFRKLKIPKCCKLIDGLKNGNIKWYMLRKNFGKRRKRNGRHRA